jgi:uncharacterized protein
MGQRLMELTLYVVVTGLASGALIGLLLSLFGGGGSVLAAPLLLYVVGLRDPHLAIGTSAAAVAANAALALIARARESRVKWACAGVFALGGLFGAWIGSSLAKLIDGRHLLLCFAAAMAAIALSMWRRVHCKGDPGIRLTPQLAARLGPIGLATGTAAGFFGIGGGFLIVPGIIAATGMTLAQAASCSLVSVALFGATTSVNFGLSGWVDLRLAGLLVAGGLAGSALGAHFSRVLDRKFVIAGRLFAGLIFLTAIYVACRALT